MNGNDHDELKKAFATEFENGKPLVIIADTTKGFGVPFMENDILWHYRFPHEGWEYDQAVSMLHKIKPSEVEDPYTPNGIPNPVAIPSDADVYNDHTTTATWHPSWMQEE